MIISSLWDNENCMSNTNNKRRCTKKSNNGLDFCGHHKISKKYYSQLLTGIKNKFILQNKLKASEIDKDLITLSKNAHIDKVIKKIKQKILNQTSKLNDKYIYKLFFIKDSWSEVLFEHRIKLSDGWWDIEFVLYCFTQQLNNTDMENPYPIFPSSPLTRRVYDYEDLVKIKNRVNNLKYPINIALKFILNSPVKYTNMWYDDCAKNNTNHTLLLLDYLTTELRFKIINYKDSQNCFTGHWVGKKEELSDFEILYNDYQNENFQIFNQTYNIFVINPMKEELQLKILTANRESWNVYEDNTREFI